MVTSKKGSILYYVTVHISNHKVIVATGQAVAKHSVFRETENYLFCKTSKQRYIGLLKKFVSVIYN